MFKCLVLSLTNILVKLYIGVNGFTPSKHKILYTFQKSCLQNLINGTPNIIENRKNVFTHQFLLCRFSTKNCLNEMQS